MERYRGFVIAGTNSGCGKTSVSLGIMGALARRGLAVAPFKTGPDFIDPGHHARAASLAAPESPVTSHNLDTWMVPPDTVRDIFARRAAGVDVAVVEGVMGLYDGFSATDEAGSTSQLAKLLGLPVILVVNAASMARSVAALVAGYADFDPELPLAGVILNRVGSDRHAELLTEALAHARPNLPVLGCLRRSEAIELPSRHLGLVTARGEDGLERYAALADWVEQGVDLDRLLENLPDTMFEDPGGFLCAPSLRIGVAMDEAFCFYYDENLVMLANNGAELVPFSPLRDKQLPEGIQGLYLGGGYPELHGHDLSQNVSLRREIKAFSESGRPVYAECGGFMYLLDSLAGMNGCTYSMCGVFPGHASMGERFSALGYREITTTRPTLLGPAGTVARGHEFHYSRLAEPMDCDTAYNVTDRKGERPPEGYVAGNTLGSYVHLHFGSNPKLARNFVDACGE